MFHQATAWILLMVGGNLNGTMPTTIRCNARRMFATWSIVILLFGLRVHIAWRGSSRTLFFFANAIGNAEHFFQVWDT